MLNNFPQWLRIRHLPIGLNVNYTTICQEGQCPNLGECSKKGLATFMLLGKICSRNCKFCGVPKGDPQKITDPCEPIRLAQQIFDMNLNYVTLTSVTRDDLSDGGSSHFAHTLYAIKKQNPKIEIEVLIPDFQGSKDALFRILNQNPSVLGHNLETVERLTPLLRDHNASYRKSLTVLEISKKKYPNIYCKSSLMLGMGEKDKEIFKTLKDLRDVGVDIITIGQYLSPSSKHQKVIKYILPSKFEELKYEALNLGIKYVSSAPLVRSSYMAHELFRRNNDVN